MTKEDLLRTENVAHSGIYVSALIILASLLVNFDIKLGTYLDLSINSSINSILVLLIGLTMFFYFVSIKLNQTDEIINGTTYMVLKGYRTRWSKEALSIATFLLICTILWIIILSIKFAINI